MSESLVPSLFVAVQKIDLYDTSQIFDLLIVLMCQYMHVYFHINYFYVLCNNSN